MDAPGKGNAVIVWLLISILVTVLIASCVGAMLVY
jgi:flagellar basal body-associated protein FliL